MGVIDWSFFSFDGSRDTVDHKGNLVIENWAEFSRFLDNGDIIWSNYHLESKTGLGHLVGIKHRFWVNKNWNTFSLKEFISVDFLGSTHSLWCWGVLSEEVV